MQLLSPEQLTAERISNLSKDVQRIEENTKNLATNVSGHLAGLSLHIRAILRVLEENGVCDEKTFRDIERRVVEELSKDQQPGPKVVTKEELAKALES